jgi:RNA-directed DNA polymerase
LGNLSTPISVQKLQMALHAKAKAEAGYRFYALYDKIYREDVLAHAYAQCRSNKGAPGVDRQDFAEVEAYRVQKWLGELALALRQETYRPDPIRRVFIPKANGKLRPLSASGFVFMRAELGASIKSFGVHLGLSSPSSWQAALCRAQ